MLPLAYSLAREAVRSQGPHSWRPVEKHMGATPIGVSDGIPTFRRNPHLQC